MTSGSKGNIWVLTDKAGWEKGIWLCTANRESSRSLQGAECHGNLSWSKEGTSCPAREGGWRWGHSRCGCVTLSYFCCLCSNYISDYTAHSITYSALLFSLGRAQSRCTQSFTHKGRQWTRWSLKSLPSPDHSVIPRFNRTRDSVWRCNLSGRLYTPCFPEGVTSSSTLSSGAFTSLGCAAFSSSRSPALGSSN